MRFTSVRHAAFLTALAGLSLGMLAGCKVSGYYEGGTRASDDQHTYVSRPHRPQTVSLIDTRTQETLWTMEIPVGKKLVVQFKNNQFPDDPKNPALMKWGLLESDQLGGKLGNSMRAPHYDSRRLDVTMRPSPELSPELSSAGS